MFFFAAGFYLPDRPGPFYKSSFFILAGKNFPIFSQLSILLVSSLHCFIIKHACNSGMILLLGVTGG